MNHSYAGAPDAGIAAALAMPRMQYPSGRLAVYCPSSQDLTGSAGNRRPNCIFANLSL